MLIIFPNWYWKTAAVITLAAVNGWHLEENYQPQYNKISANTDPKVIWKLLEELSDDEESIDNNVER